MLLVNEGELVALANVQHEVDVPLEELGQRDDDAVIQAAFGAGEPQRMVYDGVAGRRRHHRRRFNPAPVAASLATLELQALQGARRIAEAHEPTRRIGGELDLVARVNFVQPLAERAALDQALQISGREAVAAEEALQRVVAPHLGDLPLGLQRRGRRDGWGGGWGGGVANNGGGGGNSGCGFHGGGVRRFKRCHCKRRQTAAVSQGAAIDGWLDGFNGRLAGHTRRGHHDHDQRRGRIGVEPRKLSARQLQTAYSLGLSGIVWVIGGTPGRCLPRSETAIIAHLA